MKIHIIRLPDIFGEIGCKMSLFFWLDVKSYATKEKKEP